MEEVKRQLSIEGDGTVCGTIVKDVNTGEKIENIQSIEFFASVHDPSGLVTVILKTIEVAEVAKLHIKSVVASVEDVESESASNQKESLGHNHVDPAKVPSGKPGDVLRPVDPPPPPKKPKVEYFQEGGIEPPLSYKEPNNEPIREGGSIPPPKNPNVEDFFKRVR